MCTLISVILGVALFGDEAVTEAEKNEKSYPLIVMLGWTWILEILAMFAKLVFRSFRKK